MTVNNAARGPAPTTRDDEQFLTQEALVYLRRVARARGSSMERIGKQLVETIARDRMADAILDDGVSTPLADKR